MTMTNITIDAVCTKGPIYPMLLHFENGCPKEDFQISCAVLQDRNGNRQIATELNEVVYAGKEDKEDLDKTMILARNRKTGKTRLIEMGHVELKPFTKTDLDFLQQQHEAGLLNLTKNLKKHEEMVGSQKLKVDVVVQKQIRNLVAANDTPDRLDSTVRYEKYIQDYTGEQQQHEVTSLGLSMNLAKKLEEVIPQKKLKVDAVDREQKNFVTTAVNDTFERVDSPVCNDNDFEDFYLPTINREATKVEDVYCINQIFTKDEQKKIYWELLGRDCTKDLHPYVQSLVKGKILTLKQTVLAVYASELIKFKRLTKAHIRKKDFMMHIHSKTLDYILMNRLTKVVKHRNKYKKRGFNFVRVKSKQSKNRVICDVIISLLILNDYKLQLGPLCTVLNQSLQFIKNKASLLGASIVNNDGEELMQLKLPLVQHHASHIQPRNKKAAKVDLDSFKHKSSSLEPSGKFGLNKQETQIEQQDKSKAVTEQMETKKYTVTDYQHDITAHDENNLDNFYVPKIEDIRTSDEPHENRTLTMITKEHKKKMKPRDELKVDVTKTENVNNDLGYYYKSPIEANKVVSDSLYHESGTSEISMEFGSKKHKNRMRQLEKFRVDEVTDIDSINSSFTVDQRHISYDTNDADDETRSSETSKFDSKNKKKIKRRNTSKVDVKTVRKTGHMENITDNVTDDQLNISYSTNSDSDDLYILSVNRKSSKVNVDSNDEHSTSDRSNKCECNDENDLDNHKLDLHSKAAKVELDYLQKGHVANNTFEISKKNGSKKNRKQTEPETLNSDFQTIRKHAENFNRHVEFTPAYNNNESDYENSTLDTSWKFESKKRKIDQTATVKEGGINGSATDNQLDISYNTSNDSDELYILPVNRKRKSTKVNVNFLQQSKESEKTRKGESSMKERGDDFYVPPNNRQATEVEDVYPVEKILSEDEYEKIYLELQEND